MVGSTVFNHLLDDSELYVAPFSRKGPLRFDALSPDMSWLKKGTDYVINCAGVIWQAQNPSIRDTWHVNAVFPWLLQQRCAEIGAKLIHVSTDCVFSGKRGSYTEYDFTDADDAYGQSKLVGEPLGAMNIRCSIIGREPVTKRSFMEWAISNQGKQVNGYTNHVWNGVTAKQYANICSNIIKEKLWQSGIFHLHSSPVSKYELLCRLSQTLNLNLNVSPVATTPGVDRSLVSTTYLQNFVHIPSIEEMLQEYR